MPPPEFVIASIAEDHVDRCRWPGRRPAGVQRLRAHLQVWRQLRVCDASMVAPDCGPTDRRPPLFARSAYEARSDTINRMLTQSEHVSATKSIIPKEGSRDRVLCSRKCARRTCPHRALAAVRDRTRPGREEEPIRHARPRGGHPRDTVVPKEARSGSCSSLDRREHVDGRDKPGHDGEGRASAVSSPR